MSDPFSTVESEIPRDRWGRPLITPPDGGKAIAYTRCTTFVSCLEDTYNLSRWQMRMVALGLADREDLLLATAAHRDDKDKLNKICEDAQEAAKSHAPATTGTALHALTDQIDRGTIDMKRVPAAYRPDLDAYRAATAALDVVAIEQFGVHDELKVGGTCDRIYRYQGENYIGDTKTGSVEYGAGKIAMQLAVYSQSLGYDHKTKTRTARDGINTDRGIVVHLPAGSGQCQLHWVDLRAGWEAVSLAVQVRAWRARKGLLVPFTAEVPAPAEVDVAELIATAPTVEALSQIWQDHHTRWTDEYTDLARARKTLLAGGMVA